MAATKQVQDYPAPSPVPQTGVTNATAQGQDPMAVFLQMRNEQSTSMGVDDDDDKFSDDSDESDASDDDETNIIDVEDKAVNGADKGRSFLVQPSLEPTRFLALLRLLPWADEVTQGLAFSNVLGLVDVKTGWGGGCLFALETILHAAAMMKARDGTDLGGFTLHLSYAAVARDGQAVGFLLPVTNGDQGSTAAGLEQIYDAGRQHRAPLNQTVGPAGRSHN